MTIFPAPKHFPFDFIMKCHMYNLDNKWVLQYSCSRICTIGNERGWGFYFGVQGKLFTGLLTEV